MCSAFDVCQEVRSWTGVECSCHHWCGGWPTGFLLCRAWHVPMDIDVATWWCAVEHTVSWTGSRGVQAVGHESWRLPRTSAIIETMRVFAWMTCVLRCWTAFLRVKSIVFWHRSCLWLMSRRKFFPLSSTFVAFPNSVAMRETWRERDGTALSIDVFAFVSFAFLCAYCFFSCVFRFFFSNV